MPDLGNIGVSMNSNSVNFTTGYTSVGGVNRTSLAAGSRGATSTSVDAARRSEVTDRVELSEHARYMEQLRSMPPVRADKIAQIKSAIEAGTYDSDEKLSIALDRMFQDIDAD